MPAADAGLRALVEHGRGALLVLDTDARVVCVSPTARRMFTGRVDGELSARTNAAIAAIDPADLECRDGTVIAVDQQRFELRGVASSWHGRPAHLVWLRQQAGAAASQIPAFLRSALDASLDGIIITDVRATDQPIVYVNPAFLELTGYSVDEVMGRNCRFLQEHDREQEGLVALREALSRGEAAKVVIRNYRRDGSLFWNELAISPIRDASGTVTHFIGLQHDVSGSLRHEAELLRRATHDPMTGLPDRTLLLDRVQQALTLSRRRSRTVAILSIGLDGLRELNVVLGHAVGGQVLRQAADRIAGCLRDGDTLSRTGSDEFVALLPDLRAADDAVELAQRVRAALARPYRIGGADVAGGGRTGLAFGDANSDEAELLLQHAGFALQQAGPGAACIYSSELGAEVGRRRTLREQLDHAIGAGELRLRYQPQLSLRSGRIAGVEALVRWQHPTRGEILPGEFIPLAEESGQIVALGDWVLLEACRQHAVWVQRGLLDCAVAVNVSMLQLRCEGFSPHVESILRLAGLAPNRLQLELTESLLMDTSEQTTKTLHALRTLGVRLSIDDFGTGYSSLAYLRRLPVHEIKIDRSFVRSIDRDVDNAAITLSMISLAHHLRLQVVAEGVETEHELAYLKRNLCDVAQGFHIARPLMPEEFETFVSGFRPAADAHADQRPTLLLVDDEPNVLRSLTRCLRHEGYRLLTASGAEEALALLARESVQVILSDQRMPNVPGTEFLARVRTLYPQIVRMVLSGYTDLATVTDAINRGAIYRFLTKPWDDIELRGHLKDAFRHGARTRSDGEAG